MNSVPQGWVEIEGGGFHAHVGPFYGPPGGDRLVCGFMADARHGNSLGVVHGGMLATAMDTALGGSSWYAAQNRPSATVHLTVQYVGGLHVGEFAVIRSEVVRVARSLVFARGVMTVDDRPIVTADGVWKILSWRGAPPQAPGALPNDA